jgi:GDP-L-fucose synthase
MTVKKLNVFITGGHGFVGKNIVEYLGSTFPNQYALLYPSHKELELLNTEKVLDFINTNKIDIIIHCANVGGSRKTGYDSGKIDIVEKNLRMFFNLARCLGKVRRMIHFGSGAEYDSRNYKPGMPESYFGAHVPEDPYGFSKYIISKHIENSKKIICLRIFGMFGKYEDYDFKFISNSIVKNLFKLPIVINQNVYFDYMYINDAVRLVAKIMNKKMKHRTYNLTTGRAIDLVTIANKINEISDFKSEIIIKNPGLNKEYSGDNSRLMREIKIKFIPMESAIQELFTYYKNLLRTINLEKIETDEFIKYCKTGLN